MNDAPTDDHVWTSIILSLRIEKIEDRYGAHLGKLDIERLAVHLTTKRIVDMVDLPDDWEANLQAAGKKTNTPMEASLICPAMFTPLYPQDAEKSQR